MSMLGAEISTSVGSKKGFSRATPRVGAEPSPDEGSAGAESTKFGTFILFSGGKSSDVSCRFGTGESTTLAGRLLLAKGDAPSIRFSVLAPKPTTRVPSGSVLRDVIESASPEGATWRRR